MLRCKRVFKWLKQVGKDFEFFADFFRFKKSIPDKVDLHFSHRELDQHLELVQKIGAV